jgi:hypothetical protein
MVKAFDRMVLAWVVISLTTIIATIAGFASGWIRNPEDFFLVFLSSPPIGTAITKLIIKIRKM